MLLIKRYSEYINESELHQYMNNVTYQLRSYDKAYKLPKLLYRFEIIDMLNEVSDVFYERFALYMLLKSILKNVSDEVTLRRD